jgi:hypothetical protein
MPINLHADFDRKYEFEELCKVAAKVKVLGRY